MSRNRPDYSGSLRELRRAVPWVVIVCEGTDANGFPCTHMGAAAVVPHIIRHGPAAPISRMLGAFRCTRCGHRRAVMHHPSWGRDNGGSGFPPFPVPSESR